MNIEEEDPGRCGYCGMPYELVRPGKSQPICDCHLYCHFHEPPIKLVQRNGPKHYGWICPICTAEYVRYVSFEENLK